MKVTQYTDDFTVVASGSFILKDKDASAKLHIDMKPQYKFSIDMIWNFRNDDTLDDVKVEVGKFQSNIIELIIYNAKNPFGTGSQVAVPIVFFNDGMKLYCNYIVNRPTENNPRVFTYSLYLGK